jgi:hypothetical protein
MPAEQSGELVPVSTEDANASAVTIFQAGSNPYVGISSKPVSEEQGKKLLASIDPADVEIKPDGLCYLPEIKYRRILNATFGPAGWGMAPLSGITMQGNTMSREFALYVGGNFVACARGEQEYRPNNPNMSWATASEGVKSNALMRCCKDLGIASELWDPNFLLKWKEEYAIECWCENVGNGDQKGKKKKLWRRKDRAPFDYPWKENRNGMLGNLTPTKQKPSVATETVLPHEAELMAAGDAFDKGMAQEEGTPEELEEAIEVAETMRQQAMEKVKKVFPKAERVSDGGVTPDHMSPGQAKRLLAIGYGHGWTKEEMKALAQEFGGYDFFSIPEKKMREIEARLNAGI